MFDFFRKFDLYAEPIGIKYHGKRSFKTLFGGLISIMAILVVLAYAAVQVERLVMRDRP